MRAILHAQRELTVERKDKGNKERRMKEKGAQVSAGNDARGTLAGADKTPVVKVRSNLCELFVWPVNNNPIRLPDTALVITRLLFFASCSCLIHSHVPGTS